MCMAEHNRKTALITGGSGGIGLGIARELAKAGYDVAISYCSSAEKAAAACGELEALGAKTAAIKADLSSVAEIERLFSEFESSFGSLDLFVNNAGVTLKAPFLEMTERDFDTLCDLDFKGSYFCIQYAAKQMVKHGIEGSIAVITSNNAVTHFADVSAYGAIKTGLNKLAEHAALELARYNIRVNCIAPGWTDTGAARLDAKEDTYYKIPLKRWCLPEEIGKAVLFFAADSAASISGATLIIDGCAQHMSDKGERYGFL